MQGISKCWPHDTCKSLQWIWIKVCWLGLSSWCLDGMALYIFWRMKPVSLLPTHCIKFDGDVQLFMGRLRTGWNSCYSTIDEHVVYSSSKSLQWCMQLSTANDQSKSLYPGITSTIFSTSIGKADITLWSACASKLKEYNEGCDQHLIDNHLKQVSQNLGAILKRLHVDQYGFGDDIDRDVHT